MKDCRCITKVDRRLEAEGIELAPVFIFARERKGGRTMNTIRVRAAIATKPIGFQSRKKTKPVAASYCPFCGKKYTETTT